jgi:lipoprotein NlpI
LRFPRSLVFSLIAGPVLAATTSSTPLLDYAADQHFPADSNDAALHRRLAGVSHEINRYQPPESDCAHTLGARRFATLFDDLGSVQSELGHFAQASEAYEKALACTPRAPFLRAELATEMLHLGRYEEARAAIQRAVPAGRGDYRSDTILAQLDFIQERWNDAIAHLRNAVVEAPDDEQATYWQCFLWLAQKRSGVRQPTLGARKPAQDWPEPILEFLQGSITEQALLDAVRNEESDQRRREILSEALFYSGERWLQEGRIEEGRRYLEGTVRLKVVSFVEHHVALAELAKPVGR